MTDQTLENTIDVPTFTALQESVGADFVKELVDTFLDDAPKMLDDLRDALAMRDAARFKRAAHSLKSNSNTFGALELGLLARSLELAGLDQALASDPDPLARLMSEYARVASRLKSLRNA